MDIVPRMGQGVFRETLIKAFPARNLRHEVPFRCKFLRILPEAAKERLN